MQEIFSFSVKSSDKKGLDAVKFIKEQASHGGPDFSYVVRELLKQYHQEKSNGKS